jgi:hypothetical protein
MMVLFVMLILKKANNVKWDIQMASGALMMFSVMYAFYRLIIFIGEKMKYEIKDGFLMALEPTFMIPIFLCSSFIYNYKEYRTYESFLAIKESNPYLYPTLFLIRFFSIEGILLIGLSMKADEFFIVFSIILIKMLIQFWEAKKNPETK